MIGIIGDLIDKKDLIKKIAIFYVCLGSDTPSVR